mgnify:CR=1 FL=1
MKKKISLELLIPDGKKSVYDGGIVTTSQEQNTTFTEIETVADYYDIDLSMPLNKMPKEKLDILLYGTNGERVNMSYRTNTSSGTFFAKYEGVINNLERRYKETTSDYTKSEIEKYAELAAELEKMGFSMA